MKLTTRHFIGALAFAALAAPQAHARLCYPIPVCDAKRFWNTYWMLKDAAKVTAEVEGVLTHLQNAATALGGGNLAEHILLGARRSSADISAIRYSIDSVTTQYEAVFPNPEAAEEMSPSDAAHLRRAWGQEIHQAAHAASRAQSALSTIDRNTESAQAIVERSEATTGSTNDERSRIAIVKMLRIVNSALTTLATTMATIDRVNGSEATTAASDEVLEPERAERMLRDDVSPSDIPDINIPFLRREPPLELRHSGSR